MLWSGEHLIWNPWQRKCVRWGWVLSSPWRTNSTSSSDSSAWFLLPLRNEEWEQRIGRSGEVLPLVNRAKSFCSKWNLGWNWAKCLSSRLSKHRIVTISMTLSSSMISCVNYLSLSQTTSLKALRLPLSQLPCPMLESLRICPDANTDTSLSHSTERSRSYQILARSHAQWYQ